MNTFLISYDLAAPRANKHALATAIMMIGRSWARPLEQTWLVRSELDAGEIESILGRLIGDDDGLLVQATAADAVVANTSVRWFRQRRAPASANPANVIAFPAHEPARGLPEGPIDDVFELAEAV